MPDLTLSSHWLMLMLNFVLIDSCEYFGFGFSRVRFRVSWFLNDYSKTSLSKINFNSNVHSFFLQGLINLKNYDDRLYVNVDDLAV